MTHPLTRGLIWKNCYSGMCHGIKGNVQTKGSGEVRMRIGIQLPGGVERNSSETEGKVVTNKWKIGKQVQGKTGIWENRPQQRDLHHLQMCQDIPDRKSWNYFGWKNLQDHRVQAVTCTHLVTSPDKGWHSRHSLDTSRKELEPVFSQYLRFPHWYLKSSLKTR